MKLLLVAAVAVGGLAAAPAYADYVYAPSPTYATQEGPSEGVFLQPRSSLHLQMGFDASLFGTAPVDVTAISFRFDSLTDQNQDPVIPYDLGTTLVQGATFAAPIADMTGDYAQNLGADPSTLLDADYSLIADNTGPAAGPRSWGFVITFATPYLYDPSKGNLIIDIATSSTTTPFATLDMVRDTPGGEQYLFASNGAATEGAGSASFAGGPIARLTIEAPPPAPEPAVWAMMIAGFGLAGGAVRGRRVSARIAS